MTKTEKEAFAFAAHYCSIAERCSMEVKIKISRFELSNDALEELIARLKQEGFINETRYIKAFINDKFRFQKWGRLKIKQQLLCKRLEESDIDSCLSLIDEVAYNNQLETLIKTKNKLLGNTSERDKKAKIYRFVLAKGYEPSLIFPHLKQLFNDREEDEFY